MNISVRNNLKSGDIGSIIHLHGILYAKEHGYDYTFEAYVAEPLGQFAKRSNNRERIWVVESDGQVLGSIAICEASENIAQLRWFLVSPSLRGKGVGKALIQSALDFAIENGYKNIELWTVKGLNAAKEIYLAFGFVVVEEISHEVWGSTHTEQKYTKELEA